MKINPNEPIGFGSYNSQYKGQNSNNSQNFKDSNKKQEFLDIIRETLNKKEQNNDSTNTISANSATTPILTPTNPYGRADGGNYRFDNEKPKQSAEISENGRSNTATYNGGFDGIRQEESRRSGSIRTASLGFRRIYKETNLTREEKERLDELEKDKIKYAIKAYKEHENHKKPIKQNIEMGMGGFA